MKETACQHYEFRVEGELGQIWLDWFEGLDIRQEIDPKRGQIISVLYGVIPDSAALHGVLNKIRDLNLRLISAIRMPSSDTVKSEDSDE